MTEEGAKTRWCPFTRNGVALSRDPAVAATANRDSPEHYGVGNVNCIGSACMAWRWMAQTKAIDGSWNVHETEDWRGYRSEAKQGFCGLAGKP